MANSLHAARLVDDLERSRDVFDLAVGDRDFIAAVSHAAEIVTQALLAGRKLLLAGNGGSAADAQHIAAELVVRFNADRPALPAIALTTDSSVLTAIGNDLGFEQLFSRQVRALGRGGDVFLALSTSGRSPNILAACRTAREQKLTVIGFTGANGGAMGDVCDVLVRVPSDKTPFIQQVHIAAGHSICAIVEEALLRGEQTG